MKPKLLAYLLLIFFSHYCTAQTPLYSWAQKAGGTNSDEGRLLLADTAGNTYVTGECRSTPVNFGSIAIPSAYNNFIVKYSPAGTVLWAKKVGINYGANANNSITNMELDAEGNIYIIGGFAGNLIVGRDTLTSIGFSSNLYVAKYSSTGIGLWAKNKTLNAANPANNLIISKMKRVNAGNFVVLGYSQYPDTIENVIKLKFPGYFMAAIDTAGQFIKGYPLVVDTLGSSPYTFFDDIATNKLGNIYLSGRYFSFNTEIDTTHWHLPPNPSSKKSFIAKFDSNLNFKWSKANDYSPNPYWCSCGNNTNYAFVSSDDEDNVYQTGEFWADTLYYDALQTYSWNAVVQGPIGSITSNSGDIYLVKINGAGIPQWLKSYSSNQDEYPMATCTDKLSNVYITGVCAGVTSFDHLTTANGAYYSPLFVTKITANGNVAWLQGASNCNVYAKAIGEDGKGNVSVTGSFGTACDADFGPFNLTHYSPLANTSAFDMFTARIGNCNLAAPAVVQHNDTLNASVTAGFYQWYLNGHPLAGATSTGYIMQISGTYAVSIADSLGCYAFSPGRYIIKGTLSLTLLNLTATYKNAAAVINWQTTNEINTACFIVERSTNQKDFTGIGKVLAVVNNSGKQDYSFTDKEPPQGINYYRLKMVDKDGMFTYSKIASVAINKRESFTLSPNPAHDFVTVHLNETALAKQISIYNATGVQVKNVSVNTTDNTVIINTTSLSAGLYVVQVKAKASCYQKELVINK